MDRINGAGTIDIGGGRRGFRSEDLPSGTEGTEVTDNWLNAVQENIIKVIEEAGLALDVSDWSLLWRSIRFSQMADGYFSVTDRRNDPPEGPTIGDRYLVGHSPTGAWVGSADHIALWLGAWTFIAPTPWMHVGFADRTDWRWDHTLGVPAWAQWLSSETIYGPSKLATVPEIEAGTGSGVVSSAALKSKRRPFFVATSSGTKNVPNDVDTVLTQFAVSTSFLNAGSSFSAGVFTCGAADAGLWSFQGKAAMVVAAAPTAGVLRASFAKNGISAPFAAMYVPAINGTWCLPDFFSFRLAAGEQVDFRGYHFTGTNRTFDGGSIEAVRLGA